MAEWVQDECTCITNTAFVWNLKIYFHNPQMKRFYQITFRYYFIIEGVRVESCLFLNVTSVSFNENRNKDMMSEMRRSMFLNRETQLNTRIHDGRHKDKAHVSSTIHMLHVFHKYIQYWRQQVHSTKLYNNLAKRMMYWTFGRQKLKYT